MKALTISQPFASLIADGKKWIENRSWYTPYLGPLAIHAGKGTQYLTKGELARYPSGCIVAVAELVACVHFQWAQKECASGRVESRPCVGCPTWGEIVRHEHFEGPWCWVLRDVRKLKVPIPWTGAQGLWSANIQPESLEYE